MKRKENVFPWRRVIGVYFYLINIKNLHKVECLICKLGHRPTRFKSQLYHSLTVEYKMKRITIPTSLGSVKNKQVSICGTLRRPSVTFTVI